MTTIEFSGVVTALSSVSHGGGQSFGVNAKMRREKFVQPDGSVEEVPVISGNGLRGLLRDLGMAHMCRALGYGEAAEEGRPAGLSLPAFYFLFSGGALTSVGGRGLDIDRARALRELIPLVGVFGGAMGNQIMPGKLRVDKMIPICRETAHLLPAAVVGDGEGVQSIWEYLQEEMYTRKDDEKDEHKRALIDSGVRALLEAEARAKREAASQPVIQADTGQHQQMMYYVETLAAGTRFYWSLVLDGATDVEFDALVTTLVEFSRRPYIGAKSGVGLGKVAVEFNGWHTIDSRVAANGAAVDTPLGVKYHDHLAGRAADIRAALAEIQ